MKKEKKTPVSRQSATAAAHPAPLKAWIEAMRLRTLPVGAAPVVMASGLALQVGHFQWLPALICLLFALTAQIGCNFANEYYDFRDGLDKKGRVGPRRGVTEGDITPQAMHRATAIAFLTAAVIGCSLIYWGGWWMILVGLFIFVGALSYSAGPYPLSRNGMGEIAVVVFFGLIPTSLTFYLQTGYYSMADMLSGLAMGLLGSNLLIVNNYRDYEEDAAAGKVTTVVMFGRKAVLWAYFLNGLLAVALTGYLWMKVSDWALVLPGLYLVGHFAVWRYIGRHEGSSLNKALGMTAMLMFYFAAAFLLINL